MYRTVPRLVGAAVLLAALGTAAGCGGSDNTAACKAIKQDIQNVTSTGLKQTADLQGLAKTYRDGASKIREDGKKGSGDVKSAADEVATQMETLGTAVSKLGPGNTTMPDTNGLNSAGAELQTACNK